MGWAATSLLLSRDSCPQGNSHWISLFAIKVNTAIVTCPVQNGHASKPNPSLPSQKWLQGRCTQTAFKWLTLEQHVAQCMLFFEAYSVVSGSCLKPGPNNPSCSSPSSPSRWFLFSSPFPLFSDLVDNESEFRSSWSLHPSFVLFSPCGCSHWGFYFAPGLFLRSTSPLHPLLPFCCLFQPCPSSHLNL